ncbi:hypothetical protein [Massilioclostridium coli]|uniref:hypothetical protein n=1 Tax=Massilioclostridium coli TaxID=1870991 RepID=UPI0022E637D4|nr:hypothetical protein [Massilioclostridium coli]
MRSPVKYVVIYGHREEYPVTSMCNFFEVSRNDYYGFVGRLAKPEKDTRTHMPMQWQKISSPSSKQNASTGTNPPLSPNQTI